MCVSRSGGDRGLTPSSIESLTCEYSVEYEHMGSSPAGVRLRVGPKTSPGRAARLTPSDGLSPHRRWLSSCDCEVHRYPRRRYLRKLYSLGEPVG